MKKLLLLTLLFTLAFPSIVSASSMKNLDAANINTQYDITGDGISDDIELVYTNEFGGSTHKKLAVYINDNVALEEESSWGFYRANPYLITANDGSKHLLITTNGEHEESDIQAVYKYKNRKLVKEVDLLKVMKGFTSLGIRAVSLSGDTITLKMEGVSKAFYRIFLNPQLVCKDSKFRIKSLRIPLVKQSGYPGYLCNGQYFKTNKAVQGYKSYSGSIKSSTIKKGSNIKFLNYYPGNPGRFYIQVKGGKKHWIKDSGSACVDGIYYWA